jgi:hypothetical protein
MGKTTPMQTNAAKALRKSVFTDELLNVHSRRVRAAGWPVPPGNQPCSFDTLSFGNFYALLNMASIS